MGHPPRLAGKSLALGCLLLLFTTVASANKCTTGCHGMNTNKAYQEGHTYVYDLEGLSVTSVTDAQGDATLKLKATAELTVKPDCIHQLQLKNVQLNGANVQSQDLELHAVQFNYHDGHIDTQLCTEPGDSQASLNIKRAVVSLFQSAILQESGATTHHETDIFGVCPTDFSFHKEGDSLLVQKSRNLAQCSYRENINQGLISANFDSSAGVKSTPLLGSHQKIEQRFKRGILNKAVSTETYKLKPFSSGEAGAKTIVETTLTLKGDKGDAPTAPVSQPKSLIFEVPHPVIKSSVDAIVNALKATKAEIAGGVKPDAGGKFAELVKTLRLSNKNDILSVYQKVRAGAGFDKVEDQKIFLDGLFYAGSGEAAEVAVELIKNREISGVQALLFYTSLALVDHVNLPSVTAIASLLDQPNLPRLGYLGVGQVIGKYCQQHSCENTPEVKEAIHKIREKIGNGKSKTREQENLIVSALKALGNTNFLDDATMQKVANIAADKNVRNRVRVAAIDALPARCSMKWKNILFKVLDDREEDSEIRIKTYLALVECPCPHSATQIKETLDKETVNQVGSFIQSHLRNLRASTDPNKEEAKRQYGLIKPLKKFPEDFRKFSYNNEFSYNVDAFGAGAAAESNVIYSQNSFVPRSVNLNLTSEIFGRTFNFMELNTRIENLDRVLEHYMGPKGKLMQYDLEDLADTGKDATSKLSNYIKDRYEKILKRGKRDVKQGELDKFAKNVHLRGNEVDQDLDLDLSVKLFGVELAYLSYQGDSSKFTPEYIIDKMFDNIEKGFDAAKHFNYKLENYMHFLEGEIVYPTGMGTCLSLGLTGTSAVHLKTNGKIDMLAILKDPDNAAFKIALEPSVSVRITGDMVVRGFGVESGMKLITTLYTSTGSDISVAILDGKGIDVNFGIPKKKQELISFSSEVLFSSGPKGEKYEAPKFGKGKQYNDCFEQFSTLLGLTVCGEISFPYDSIANIQQKPIFPLSGPSKFGITVENNDVTSYHFKVLYDTHKPTVRSFNILIDTPNSKTNRRISLTGEGGLEPNIYAKISLDSPIKKASAEVVLKNVPEERSIRFTVLHDQIEYFARLGILADGSKYKPLLEYKVPEDIERLANVKTGGKPGQQYNMQGAVDVSDYQNGKKYVFENVALVSGGQKILGIDGSVISTPDIMNVDTKLNYADESLALKLDGKRLEKYNYAVSLSVMPSKDPNIGFNVKWDYKRGPTEFDQKLVFVHGPDPNSKVNCLTLEQNAVYKMDPKDLVLSTSNELTYPAMKMKYKLSGKVTPNSISGDVEVKYEKFKLGSELKAKMNSAKKGDYDIEFEAELLENSVKVKASRVILDPHQNKFKNSIELSPGGKYDADAVVTYDVKKDNINVQLDGDINLNGKKMKIDTGLTANQQSINSRVYVTISDIKYIEFLLKARRSPNPTGSLNLNLKNYLTANGQFVYQNGKGNAHLNIDMPKMNRKMKATGDLAVSGNHHVGNIELLYDAEKDPSKRIKWSIVADITNKAVDMKNVIEVLKNKLELNAKGSLEGTLNEGLWKLDMDMTLPNGRYIVLKQTRNSVKKDNKYDIQMDSEIIDHVSKGGKSQKITYKAEGKNMDPKSSTFEAHAVTKYVDYEGRDMQLAWNLKNLLRDDKKRDSEIEIDVSGGLVPKRLQFQLGAIVSDEKSLDYNLKSSLGDDYMFKSNGFYKGGEGMSYNLNNAAEMKLPCDKLRNLKLNYAETFVDPEVKNGELEYTVLSTVTYNDDKTVKLESYVKLSGLNEGDQTGEGTGKLTLVVLKSSPLTIGGNYKYDLSGDKKKASSSCKVNYGDKEATLSTNTEYLPDLSFVDLKAKSGLPFEKLRKLDLQLTHKRENDGKKRNTEVAVVADNAKYTMKSELEEDDMNRSLHAVMTSPNGKTEVFSKFQKLGEREYKAEWKVDTPKGFVVADALVNLESVDNFVINANFDSDKIKPRKIHAEIANKPTAKSGRRIVVTVTSDGQNIVTGSTNYKKRIEDGKTIVEGNGNLKIGEDTQSSSFKYTRQELTRETDGEVGVAIVLNTNFGPSSIVGELKLSNKELQVFNSYCEQNKDCAHFKLQSTLDTDQKSHLKHQITVEVDLKKFNVPAEFGLKTNTEYKNFILDHAASLYLHSTKEKSEYSYQMYSHLKESGIVLTLPSRELALISTFDLPKTKQTGAYKFDISLYLDRKNKPSDKTSLTAFGDINVSKGSVSVNGETKFTYPSQPKDMSVKGRLHYGGKYLLDANLDIDVFAKKSQKITVTANMQKQEISNGHNATGLIEITSRGQQLKVDLKSHIAVSKDEIGFGSFLSYTDQRQKPKSVGGVFSANMKRIYLYVTGPNKRIIESDTKMEFNKNLQKIDSETSILDAKPEVMSFEANDMNTFNYQYYSKAKPGEKLVANGRVVLGQLANIHADLIKDGAKKNLFNAMIHLDEGKFLKPEFSYNKDNIVLFVEIWQQRSNEIANQLKDVAASAADEIKVEGLDFLEHLKKAQPNIKPLMDYYQTELNKLKNELHADETVKEIQATLNKYFGAIAAEIIETTKEIVKHVTELQQQLNEIISKLSEAMKAAYPQLKDSYEKILKAGMEIFKSASNLFVTYLKGILNIINEHQKELNDAAAFISDMTQDVAKIIFKSLRQIRQDVQEFVVLLVNQLKALPIYETAKEKYAEIMNFEIPEAIVNPIEEVCNIIKRTLPTTELREFFEVTCDYIIKHVKHQKVDDASEIKKIYTHAVTAIQSILSLLQSQTSFDNVFSLLQNQAPIDLSFLSKFPGIFTLKVSILNLLRNRELPSPLDIYYTYRPTRYPNDLIPPFSMTGKVIDGGHITTFDGRQMTLPGSCNYILAQDMQDGNFSVVANFNNGVLISVTVTEPKESITLKSNGNILVNNKPADYPASTKNLHAFLVGPSTNVKSDYGVRLACSNKAPMICIVRVSGFYLGKLRGLFGDGNNEPFDDFTLPSGKITTSPSDFGNAYKLKGDCPAVNALEHTAQKRAPICTQYFASQSSTLKSCFNYVDPVLYRETCDLAVSAGSPERACLIASAYYATCYEKGVFGTSIPPACTNCKVGANTIAVGDAFSVKIPKKEADIIFVVEQFVGNEKVFKEMIKPLMSELREELKHHGVSDVHIGLIGFSEKMKWPQHYTVNGNTNIEGDVKNMKFGEPDPVVTLQDAREGDAEVKLTYLLQKLNIELGTFELTDAYEEAIRYPYRPGAAKAVVGVLTTLCEKSLLPISLQQARIMLGHKIYRDMGLTYYHVSYPMELLVSGKPQKNIVGYDRDSVYTFADSKKKPLTGNTDTKSNLATATTDVCADFAVSSGGAAFSSNNFLEAKPNQRKQFIQVAARRIADGLVNVEIEEDCKCEQQFGFIAQSHCKIVGRTDKRTAK